MDLAHKNTIVMMEIDLVKQKTNSQGVHPWDEMVNSGKLSSETNIRFFKGLHYILYEGAYILEEDACEQKGGDKEIVNAKSEYQSNPESGENKEDEDSKEDNDDDEYEYEYEYEEDEDVPFFESFSVSLLPFYSSFSTHSHLHIHNFNS